VKQNKNHHNLNKNKITPTNSNNNVQQQKMSWSKDNLERNMQQNHEITCVVHADLKNPEAEKFPTCSNFFWGKFISKSLLKACMDSWRHTCSDHECEGLTGVMWTSRLQWCCLQHTYTHTQFIHCRSLDPKKSSHWRPRGSECQTVKLQY
jgi:hypothetical protein